MDRFELYLIVLLLGCMCTSAHSQESPAIDFTEGVNESGVAVEARITDRDGDLVSATLYALEENTLDVLWTEHRIIQGGDANLSFFWPRQGWRVTNGTDYVQPVLAVNTIDMPPEEAPYLVYSAPCLVVIIPGAQVTTALAYFDNEGVFHSLTDLSGNSFYKSNEFLAITGPGTSYGSYIKNNITLIVGVTNLSFLRMNLDGGLSPLPPLVLDRSPIHHYTLRLEKVDAGSIPYIMMLEADDASGNSSRMFTKNMAQSARSVR